MLPGPFPSPHETHKNPRWPGVDLSEFNQPPGTAYRILEPWQLLQYNQPDPNKNPFENAIDALIRQQGITFQMFIDGRGSLPDPERPVAVHINQPDEPEEIIYLLDRPGREGSAGNPIAMQAAAQAAGKRACRLDPDQQPADQRGVPFSRTTIAFLNPVPNGQNHLTFIHNAHQDQMWAPLSADAVHAAISAGEGKLIGYNAGPSGASILHPHFQRIDLIPSGLAAFNQLDPSVASKSYLRPTLEAALGELTNHPDSIEAIELVDGVNAFVPTRLQKTVLILSGSDPWAVHEALNMAISKLPIVKDKNGKPEVEPRMNICMEVIGDELVAYLFPRTKHRDSQFDNSSERAQDTTVHRLTQAFMEAYGMWPVVKEVDRNSFVTRDGDTPDEITRRSHIAAGFIHQSCKEVYMPSSDFVSYLRQDHP